MSFKSLQSVMVHFRVSSPLICFDYQSATTFIARHQTAFMLPCAFAIGFMIACSV
ncbi:hypothetical protein [Allorhizobium taibaishanense]|uniref:Uncharacterized protein n=1 Tax=Allorhizobium taibaishanense TaxID=887144 RepID=A0A7W6HII7_9HYPH|nr:hypothetical protein [Allorhizobium taibaishanense]MBB4005831.1 hypothetical protein [Allorhizobium taibaishanense]